MIFGHNFWLGGPIDEWSMRLNYILQDLFKEIPPDHIWALQIWSSGVSLKRSCKSALRVIKMVLNTYIYGLQCNFMQKKTKKHSKNQNRRFYCVNFGQHCHLNICCYIGWNDKYSVFVNSTNTTTNNETAALSSKFGSRAQKWRKITKKLDHSIAIWLIFCICMVYFRCLLVNPYVQAVQIMCGKGG